MMPFKPIPYKPKSVSPKPRDSVPCLRSDCNHTFADKDVRDLHMNMIHKRDVPKPPSAMAEISEEIDRLREQKSMYFKLCPPRVKVEDPTIYYCREPTCGLMFVDEELRNFHYNRIQNARDLSMLRKLEESPEETEKRLYGFECMKADCETRAMTQELRDFHVQREHPKVWEYVQEILDVDNLVYPQRIEKEKEEVFDKTIRDTHPDLGSRQTTQDSIFSQKDSGYTTDASSVADGEECVEKPEALKEDKQEVTMTERLDLDPRSNEFKEREFVSTDRANRATLYPRSRAYFMMSRNTMANPGATMWRPQLNEEKEILSPAVPIATQSDCVATNTVEKQIVPIERPNRATLYPRSRGYFMMSRNAVANPGASMWRPQPQEET